MQRRTSIAILSHFFLAHNSIEGFQRIVDESANVDVSKSVEEIFSIFLPSSVTLLDVLRNCVRQMIYLRSLMSHVVIRHRSHHLRMMMANLRLIISLMVKSHRPKRREKDLLLNVGYEKLF